jgi:transcriptional regulator with XRE-family HTH domain
MSLDLSLRDGAKRIGVDAATLSRWERGLSRPRSDQALKYGEVIAGWLATVEILERAK